MKNRIGEIGYNNQGKKMTIIRYRGCEDIDVQFEDKSIVCNRSYDNFKKGTIKHPIRYEETFAYYIEVELGLNLDNIWNWERNNKNNINPYEIYKSCNKKVWLYCQEHDYHNDYGGYEISCLNFYHGHRCGYCNSKKVHYKDSLAYNYPNIARMIAIEENNLTFDDCYDIACRSKKRFYFKCLDCKNISNKRKTIDSITSKKKYSCEFCSDGISIPNKLMANVLKQINKEFITELSSKEFSGKNYFYYDFYLPKYKMIIEANGEQHYEECTLTKRTLFEEQMNDLFKYKCAKSHVDNYIVIDCRYSTLEWMKENIIKELSPYFNLSNIDWELAWEQSQKSKVVETWNLWNSGMYKISEISKILEIDAKTVREYLKRGTECKKCIYNKEDKIII